MRTWLLSASGWTRCWADLWLKRGWEHSVTVNGALSLSTLTLVDGWAYLMPNTAAAWNAGCDELVRLGYARPTITAPDGAYRTLARQEYWKKFWSDRGQPLNAATVGTSGHGWATDVDIFNVGLWPHDVLERVFGKYGFTFNFSPEPWHMHHNGLAVAGLNITPIAEQEEVEEEDDMFKPKLIKRTEGTAEWSLCAPFLVGPDIQQGYIVTDSEATATAWARLYDRGIGNETKGNRAEYVEMQKQAREIRKQWLAAEPTPASTTGGATKADIQAAVLAAMKAAFAAAAK